MHVRSWRQNIVVHITDDGHSKVSLLNWCLPACLLATWIPKRQKRCLWIWAELSWVELNWTESGGRMKTKRKTSSAMLLFFFLLNVLHVVECECERCRPPPPPSPTPTITRAAVGDNVFILTFSSDGLNGEVGTARTQQNAQYFMEWKCIVPVRTGSVQLAHDHQGSVTLFHSNWRGFFVIFWLDTPTWPDPQDNTQSSG